MTVGARVRELRIAQGMSQAKLAGEAGVTQTCISDIENERKRIVPNGKTLIGIAKALHCGVGDLTDEKSVRKGTA